MHVGVTAPTAPGGASEVVYFDRDTAAQGQEKHNDRAPGESADQWAKHARTHHLPGAGGQRSQPGPAVFVLVLVHRLLLALQSRACSH